MKKNSIIQHNSALIVFSREPIPGETKTRLLDLYTPEQCAELHKCFIKDIAVEVGKLNADVIVSYTGGEPHSLRAAFGDDASYREQCSGSLGERMSDAFKKAFEDGYEKVVLIGTDIPELQASTLITAFDRLDVADAVIGPTCDGGYYLIGMKENCEAAFNVRKYGVGTVFDETIGHIEGLGKTVSVVDKYSDIDEADDIIAFIARMRNNPGLRLSDTAQWIAKHRKVSVIIPVYNEQAVIGDLQKQLAQFKDTEIIFVDGGSTDNTLQLIGDSYRVISCKKGRAVQMNAGAKASTGDILFFLHADSKLPSNALQQIYQCLIDNQYGCFGVKFESHNFFMWTNRVISNHRAWHRGLPFGDQGIFMDRDLFFEIGMFPEIPIMEDYEMSLRLRDRGIKPGHTTDRIITSNRRYPKNTIGILKTEYQIWNYRRKYRQGIDPNSLAKKYGDIR